MARVAGLLAVLACIALLVGCGSKDSAESKQSQMAAKEQAATWTPEMKEKFKVAKTDPENQR